MTDRALIVAAVDTAGASPAALCANAERLVAGGADVLEVDSMEAAVALAPLAAVATMSVEVALAVPVVLVVRTVDEAAAAIEAGLAASQVVLDVGATLRPTESDRSAGYPLLATVGPPDVAAKTAVAILGGCRRVRTGDVRAARRTADVLAAILEAGQ